MANLPAFTAFSPATETWDAYLEQFECFLEENDFTGLSSGRKREYFFSVCGHEMFGKARALAAPQSVHSMPWETLLEKLKNHYSPTPSRIARRYAFKQRTQREGESVSDYMASLRTAALHCDLPVLDDALLEQLVCGIKDLRLQRRLPAQKELSLQAVVDGATAHEMLDKSTAEIQRFLPPATYANRDHAVQYEEDDEEDFSDEEEEISRLKLATREKQTHSSYYAD